MRSERRYFGDGPQTTGTRARTQPAQLPLATGNKPQQRKGRIPGPPPEGEVRIKARPHNKQSASNGLGLKSSRLPKTTVSDRLYNIGLRPPIRRRTQTACMTRNRLPAHSALGEWVVGLGWVGGKSRTKQPSELASDERRRNKRRAG